MLERELEVESPKNLAEALRAIEAEIRDLDHERGFILTSEGKVRLEATGSENDVWLGLGTMQVGEVSVHNHPSLRGGWHPPSPVDWAVLLDFPVGEMRVVSEHWTYHLKAPVGGWPLNHRFRRYWTGEKMRFGLNLKEMVAATAPRIEAQLPHWYSAERRQEEGSELMHKAWESIANEVGAEYGREPAWEKLLPAVQS
jgi:hypothetical protein